MLEERRKSVEGGRGNCDDGERERKKRRRKRMEDKKEEMTKR